MKRLNIFILGLGLLLIMPSCNKFLDTMPDKRTELNRADKIKALLVSAYPTMHQAGITEHRTDNVQDNGTKFADSELSLHENYHWKPMTEANWDCTQGLWTACYASIATANQALVAIKDLGSPEDLQASVGEALLCRAWGHYLLAGVFCHAYNSQTSESDLGLPYFEQPETTIDIKAERLTVAETFAKIEADIKAGLPLIDDENYEHNTRKYHFNKRAAYAFAAEFYLFYEKWEEAKKYATLAIGEAPATSLRNLDIYGKTFTNSLEWTYGFISTKDPSNLMLQATRSLWGRRYNASRYAHAEVIARNQTLRSFGGWGKPMKVYDVLYYLGTPKPMVFQPKFEEIFEVKNVLAKTGQPHVVMMPFTVDKTLLIRAEAEILLGEYDAAVEDLNYWYASKGGIISTKEKISEYYNVPPIDVNTPQTVKDIAEAKMATICKPLHPRFAKKLEKGLQTNLIHAVLHARRLVSIHDGSRWHDVKRYGIVLTHELYDGTKLVLKKNDPRRAIQIPADIITAGLQANPQ